MYVAGNIRNAPKSDDTACNMAFPTVMCSGRIVRIPKLRDEKLFDVTVLMVKDMRTTMSAIQ